VADTCTVFAIVNIRGYSLPVDNFVCVLLDGRHLVDLSTELKGDGCEGRILASLLQVGDICNTLGSLFFSLHGTSGEDGFTTFNFGPDKSEIQHSAFGLATNYAAA